MVGYRLGLRKSYEWIYVRVRYKVGLDIGKA